jgi:hypothetical protein
MANSTIFGGDGVKNGEKENIEDYNSERENIEKRV